MSKRIYILFIMIWMLTFISGCSQLPVKPEKNDWSTIWIENTNATEKPRLLFVGDSILDGYYPIVRASLSDQYYLARYTTSKFVGNTDFRKELEIILKRYQFDVIHINNGLHGGDYSETDYQKGLKTLIRTLNRYAPNAKIIWCMTTPIRLVDDIMFLDSKNQGVLIRNEVALELMEHEDYLINDLYSHMVGHPEFYKKNGIHFNNQGKATQADIVVSFIQDAFPEPTR